MNGGDCAKSDAAVARQECARIIRCGKPFADHCLAFKLAWLAVDGEFWVGLDAMLGKGSFKTQQTITSSHTILQAHNRANVCVTIFNQMGGDQSGRLKIVTDHAIYFSTDYPTVNCNDGRIAF